jgi:DNA-binding GntR family transcriptional regulator
MYIVRETLEAASLASAVANATDADRAAIVASNDLLQQAIDNGDPLTYHRQSRHFHLALTRPSRMFRLLHMLESAWNITEPVQSMVHVAPSDRAALHADHRQMVDAFLADDVEQLLTVAELHAQHLNAVITTLPTDTGLLLSADISSTQ